MLTGLTPAKMVQQDLFQPAGKNNGPIMAALDRINARWGRDTVQYASAGITRPWCMVREHKSPAYTTSWKELPVAWADR